jgi:hypothetical protein
VDGDGGFPRAAFLIRDNDRFHERGNKRILVFMKARIIAIFRRQNGAGALGSVALRSPAGR